MVGRIYGYIRTSRRQTQGQSGSDPEAQVLQLRDAGVPSDLIYRDVGISGATGTNSRKGWRALNARLCPGDVLVVAAVDRIGRRWMDTVSTLRDLRGRKARVRSLAPSEQHWTRYFDADPDSPEAVIGGSAGQLLPPGRAPQELESIRRRTKAGLDKARSNGKTLGTPRKMTDLKVEMARSFRRDGLSFRQIGTALGVSRTTVSRYLAQQ